jgi:hypothetical protein
MFFPEYDWLVIWKIYHYPWFFWMYAAVSASVRMLVLPRLNPASPIRTWFLSSTASLLIVPAVPFLVLPAFALVVVAAGKSRSVFIANGASYSAIGWANWWSD